MGSMISLHFTDEPVVDFKTSQKGDNEYFKRYFHAMLANGVYLPPSAYESYFLNDANFLSPDSLVSPYFESVKVFCYNTERGIKIRCFNLGRSNDNTVSFSLVRRNVSLGEDKFVPVVTEPDSTNVIIRFGESQDANLSFDLFPNLGISSPIYSF